MTASPARATPMASTSAAAPAAPPRRRIVDAPTRVFHWLFALSFAGAYITADGERWRALHVTLGYVFAGLLAWRVIDGLVGPKHARLSMLVKKLASAPHWVRGLAAALRTRTVGSVNLQQGQHLAMAAAIVATLALALPLALSGYGTYQEWGEALGGGEWLEEVHELLGNTLLAAALVHVGLLAALSVQRKRNLALPMITGRIEGRGPDLAPRNRAWLAALMVVAVAAFVAWQWQATPQGLRAGGTDARAEQRHHDHDDD